MKNSKSETAMSESITMVICSLKYFKKLKFIIKTHGLGEGKKKSTEIKFYILNYEKYIQQINKTTRKDVLLLF